MTSKHSMNQFIDMNLQWAKVCEVDTIELLGYLTAYTCLLMAECEFTAEMADYTLERIADKYKEMISDFND